MIYLKGITAEMCFSTGNRDQRPLINKAVGSVVLQKFAVPSARAFIIKAGVSFIADRDYSVRGKEAKRSR